MIPAAIGDDIDVPSATAWPPSTCMQFGSTSFVPFFGGHCVVKMLVAFDAGSVIVASRTACEKNAGATPVSAASPLPSTYRSANPFPASVTAYGPVENDPVKMTIAPRLPLGTSVFGTSLP